MRKTNTVDEKVKIEVAKIQPEDGSTICYGTFNKKYGGYADWVGEITDISGGTIGFARLK
jgi:hypothetical protein